MEHTFELELKSISEDGTFEGWASVYGNIDTQKDRIEPGAFSADDGKEVPLLADHKRDAVVGVGILKNMPQGVKVLGKLLLDTEAGREAYARLKAGATKGLSVGFRLLQSAMAGAVRSITAGSIAEVSLTAFPANPAALVTAVKSEFPDCPARALVRWL